MYFSIFFLLPIICAFTLYPVKKMHISSYIYTTKKSVDFSTKIKHFNKLIRSESILSTSLLCFTGGFIINPSLITLFTTPSFIISTINTITIMSSSMIINDIFDIETDKLNSPTRPLVNGDVSKKEAFVYLFGLLSFTEFLNMRFLSSNLQNIVHFAILNILLYTPIYKRIPFIKNIFCAAVVSFSIFYNALSATKGLIELNPRFPILSVTLSILFFSVWYNEVLLDMKDIEGDRENNIYTIPVLYGPKNAWIFAFFLLYFNIISNTLSLSYLFGRSIGMILPLIFSPIVYDCLSIPRESFSKESIKHALKNTKNPLFIFVLYLCSLSLYNSGFTFSFQEVHWLEIASVLF